MSMAMMTRFYRFRVEVLAFVFFATGAALMMCTTTTAFAFSPQTTSKQPSMKAIIIKNRMAPSKFSPLVVAPLRNSITDDAEDNDEETATATASTTSNAAAKLSLEEKMRSWEATEDEIKASTLGGVIPKSMKSSGGDSDSAGNRSDAFDVGLYIAFPIMVLSGLALVAFPFLIGNVDVTSAGPPPTS